jgi:hypothetical protein
MVRKIEKEDKFIPALPVTACLCPLKHGVVAGVGAMVVEAFDWNSVRSTHQ